MNLVNLVERVTMPAAGETVRRNVRRKDSQRVSFGSDCLWAALSRELRALIVGVNSGAAQGGE
ncbi:MAG: hypothetical protein WCJ42_12680 [Actinomycetes bacterium]